MSDIDAAWTTWWQSDIPCEFSQSRTLANKDFLTQVLGAEWLTKRIKRRGREANPIVHKWTGSGAGHYLELNGLAEDLRILQSKPGLLAVLSDLKNTQRCLPTWHMIHCAALFERADPGIVQHFFVQRSQSAPDFLMKFKGLNISVEAKLLTKSDKEEFFEEWASKISKRLFDETLLEKEFLPAVYLIMKDLDNLGTLEEIRKAISEGINLYKGQSIKAKFEKFNVIICPSAVKTEFFSCHRCLCIFCPRHPKEDIRVEGRSKLASKQLSTYTINQNEAGFFCIGIGRLQNPHYLRQQLLSRFAQGQYFNISSVMLLRTGTHIGAPRRSIMDAVEFVTNVKGKVRIPGDLALKPVGLLAPLVTGIPAQRGIPAYIHSWAEGRIKKKGGKLFLPDIKSLSEEMLN